MLKRDRYTTTTNNKPPFDIAYWISKMDESPTLPTLFKLAGYEGNFKTEYEEKVLTLDFPIGSVWEQALAACMPFTSRIGGNAKGKDFGDGTDAKAGMASEVSPYATIGGFEHKTGTLRAFACSPVDNFRLHFLLIPNSYYSSLGKKNIKLGFHPSSGKPTASWEPYLPFVVKYFSDVCAKV